MLLYWSSRQPQATLGISGFVLVAPTLRVYTIGTGSLLRTVVLVDGPGVTNIHWSPFIRNSIVLSVSLCAVHAR